MVSAWYQFGTVDGQNIMIRLTLHYLSLVVYPTIHGYISKPGFQTGDFFQHDQFCLRYNLLLLPPSASMDSKNRFPSLLSEEDAQELVEDLSREFGGGCLFPFPARFEMSHSFKRRNHLSQSKPIKAVVYLQIPFRLVGVYFRIQTARKEPASC